MTLDTLFNTLGCAFKKLSFNSARQLIFLEDLSVLIHDGVPANRAISMLTKLYTGISQEIAFALEKGFSEGKPLAEAMMPWFNTSTVELVRAGEEGGTLAHTLQAASTALKEKSNVISTITSTLLYPLVVLIAGCFIIVYINHSIFIDFQAIKPASTWPAVGRALIVTANIIQYGAWLIIFLFIISGFALRYVIIHYTGVFRPMLDKLPVFSVYRTLTAARLMETLGLLVGNGIVFKVAIQVLQKHATPYLAWHLINIQQLLSAGKDNIAEVLNTGLIHPQDIMRLRVIAEAKGFEHALIRLGKFAAIEGNKTIRLAAKITAGTILAVGGGLIIFMIFAIYLVGMSLGSIS